MKKIRKTKIICTLGPATDPPEVLRELMLEGMDVARFNFSHGTHGEQKKRFEMLKKMRSELGLPVAAILDTKGPEIRLGNLKGGKAVLKEGQEFVLTTKEVEGDENRASITYRNLSSDLKPGGRVLIDDGLIEMEAVEVTKEEIRCRVINGGVISDKKGVNVPDAMLSMPYISEKDYEDIVFGVENGFDFIAASFVQNAENIKEIRRILSEHECNSINIIAKIENRQGVENIDEIIAAADGIMVARGDMGVEIPLEEVPSIQKMIITKVYMAGKQVITATQMLDSMIKHPRPTRAEATDVANAIYDGTSAIMLSGETAAGAYPVEALKTMVKIALRTEADIDYWSRFKQRTPLLNPDITNAISHATCMTAADLNAAAIVTVTQSGFTGRMISKYRPACPIISCTTSEGRSRQLNLSWGVTPLVIGMESIPDALFEKALDAAEAAGIVKQGELVVITAGVPLGVSGTTNLIKVMVAGHILISGSGVTGKKVSGNLCVCRSIEELKTSFKAGDIIVVEETSNEMMPFLKDAAGIVAEKAGKNSHAQVVGLSLDIPVLLGAANATQILKHGSYVTLDAKRGVVTY